MDRSQIFLLFILFSFQTTFSQNKTIKGDTSRWLNKNKEFHRTLNLTDFETSTNEFDFRFRYNGQIIEITKDSLSINGSVTNYIYHTKKANRKKTDTLVSKVVLSPEKAKNIYSVIISSGILILPSDRNIKNWERGADGITYIVEHANKNDYWQKSYWTPSSQDSIPEALIFLDVIRKLSDSLELDQTYKKFRESLPKKGCYNNGGMVSTCYISNSLELGYSGATKLPLGFYASYGASYIGKAKVNFGMAVQYNFNNDKFHHLDLLISKWNIIYKASNFSDFMIYKFQDRKVDIDEPNNRSQDHQVKYGLNLKNNFSVGAGLDYLVVTNRKLGSHLYFSKYFSKTRISTEINSSIFIGQINYKAQTLRSFYLDKPFMIRGITLGVAYENFIGYKDLYFNTRLLF